MTCGIYEIKNLETNQSYIGRSINIENRWKGHKTAPTNNMLPTIELYERNPEKVEFNIIYEIDETAFDKEELKFITSVCELYEINQRGGWESKNLINEKDGSILACPPSILSKRELLPPWIDIEDIVYGIEQWYHTWHYTADYNPKSDLYWFSKYKDLEDDIKDLKNMNENLKKSIKNNENIYKQKMEVDYEYFTLKKRNAFLKDKVDELQSKVDFWKPRCKRWRSKYHEFLEKRCKNNGVGL